MKINGNVKTLWCLISFYQIKTFIWTFADNLYVKSQNLFLVQISYYIMLVFATRNHTRSSYIDPEVLAYHSRYPSVFISRYLKAKH